MGGEESGGSERADEGGTVLRKVKFFPGARGECLEELSGVLLHLGCGGKKWDGWINIDIANDRTRPDVASDIRKLELPSDHADAICAIHVIEHFYAWEVLDILKEWHRVLKPGGRLILECPCMDKIIGYMLQRLSKGEPLRVQMTWLALWGDPKHQEVGMCHKWGYTSQMLQDLLKDAGFTSVFDQQPKYHMVERDMRIVGVK